MQKFRHSALFYTEFKRQLKWRKDHISTKEFGYKNLNKNTGEPERFPHIVPYQNWEETLYNGISKELLEYINRPEKKIMAHDYVHNLLSSWVLCANLYFLARINQNFRAILTDFLKFCVSDKISSIEIIELEFAFPIGDPLHPNPLLGEKNGIPGQKQTSPDMAFLAKTIDGNDAIILTESKYTEHHFYGCSTNPDNCETYRNPNPDFSRCMQPSKGYDYKRICHQRSAWYRKYMNLISFSEQADTILNNCPAATDGYQLFRQHALAEGIAHSGRFELVVSAVAYDGRNDDLIGCLKSTGINDFTIDWEKLFTGKALFKTWKHQDWVDFVRKNQVNGEFAEWTEYLKERYGY